MMIKKLILPLICFSLLSQTAESTCPAAYATTSPGFCASFQVAAQCYCEEAGVPKSMCNNMSTLYNRMISRYGTVDKACSIQHNTDKQTCLDDWKCYRDGGNNSAEQPCSGTSNKCP